MLVVNWMGMNIFFWTTKVLADFHKNSGDLYLIL